MAQRPLAASRSFHEKIFHSETQCCRCPGWPAGMLLLLEMGFQGAQHSWESHSLQAVCTGLRGAKNIVSCEQKMSELFWFPLSFFFFVLFFLKATFSIPLCRSAGYLLTWSRKTRGKGPFDTAGTR